jgi:pimeloyl-ACP methyl ester carboxylesterase
VVFEAGGGCGRTFWDPVLPLLAGTARLVAYDRAGRALSGRATSPLSIEDMAADLVAMTEAIVPGEFVLVAHSMGGLVARRAAGRLGSRLRGLLLADILPETSPVYDNWDQTIRNVDRVLALAQPLTRFRPLARLFTGNLRRLYAADTYQAMLAEDFTPAGTAQTRMEMQAVAAAVPQFRAQPPLLPECPTIVLSVTRDSRGRERQLAANREHQRRYAQSLPGGRYEVVDSAHFIQAEQPQLLASRIQELFQASA